VRAIVHIGYHKTATTWFQQQVYPRSVSHRWIDRARAQQALLAPCGLAFDPAEAAHLLADPADPRPPAICEENLSGYIHNDGLHGLMAPEAARRIKAVLPDALIVIVVRAQPGAIAASYVQYIRAGGTASIRNYLFSQTRRRGALSCPFKAPRFGFAHFEYDRLIAHYDALFGADNVLVLPYEQLAADPDAFLDAIAVASGLDVDRAGIHGKTPNRSFGRLTIALGRFLGLFTARSVADKHYLLHIPGFYHIRRKLLESLARFDRCPRAEHLLGRRLTDDISSRYARSNARLERLRPLDLRALGYPVADAVTIGNRRPTHAPARRRAPLAAVTGIS
jgi:hypothetical protein